MKRIAQSNQTRPGVFTKILAVLAAIDAERLATCSRDDYTRIRNIGLSMVLSFLFLSFLTITALEIALGSLRLLTVALGLLIAGAVILFDQSVVFSHWYGLGRRIASRRGFDPAPIGIGERATGFVVAAFRIGLSFALSFTLASYCELALWEADILSQMAKNNRAENAKILASARTAVQDEIDHVASRIDEIDIIAGQYLADARSADTANRESHEELESQIRDLRRRANDFGKQLACVRLNIAAEERGIEDCSGVTRDQGKGDRYWGFVAQEENLRTEKAMIDSDLARLLVRREQLADQVGNAVTLVQPRLRELNKERGSLATRIAQLQAEREVRVSALVENDPGFVQKADGLIIRQEAFAQLVDQSPTLKVLSLAIKVVVMMIEMAGVLAALLQFRPSIYALYTVTEFEVDAANRIADADQKLSESWKKSQDRLAGRENAEENVDAIRRKRETASQTRKWFDQLLNEGIGAVTGGSKA